MNKVRISKYQLIMMVLGFMYGVVINPAASAKQDGWLVIILTTFAAVPVVFLFVYISLLNPEKNLLEILKRHFGKYVGSIIGLLYVWYFLHLAAIVIRNFGDFVVITIFPETPVLAVIIAMAVVIAFAVRKGLEVMARSTEILIIFVPVSVIIITSLMLGSVDIKNWKPFLEKGIIPVLKVVKTLIGFPVGELVIFLMIFPALNDKKKLLKSTLIGVFSVGLIFFIVNVRDLFVLGADMYSRSTFPSALAIRLIPKVNLDPFYLVSLLLGGSLKVAICIYAAVKGLAEIFSIDNYKPFVLPMTALMVALSIWLYESFFEVTTWSEKNYFAYAFPFEFIIPIILLLMSIYKKYKSNKENK
ncbi:MAG: GerAB/ArcD/ProY family transporter [Halothermotrichaceae bacterium]